MTESTILHLVDVSLCFWGQAAQSRYVIEQRQNRDGFLYLESGKFLFMSWVQHLCLSCHEISSIQLAVLRQHHQETPLHLFSIAFLHRAPRYPQYWLRSPLVHVIRIQSHDL